MQNSGNITRFSSCRGVTFETKPYSDPGTIPARTISWLPRGALSRIVPSGEFIERSASRSSSHFCDLEFGNNDDDESPAADVESGEFVNKPEGNLAQHTTKQKQSTPSTRLSVILLDQGLFTVYKRLFLIALAANLAGLILTAAGKFPYARRRTALFSIANIFVSVLCRNEIFLRIVFWLAVNAFGWPWIPLRIKTMATAFLQSLGGIHSGCGVSSIAWLVGSLIITFQDSDKVPIPMTIVACAILALICVSSLAAFPAVRHLHHNVFERTHRFAGWAALALLWVFVTLTVYYNPATNIKSGLVKNQEFWFTTGITILIILPWISVRKVPVRISSPSGHASIIKFDGGVRPGILGRISPSPFSEWHAFGIISDNKSEHMMLAGAVGDFTRSLVANPPTHLWVRRVRFPGLPYLTNMYNRVLLVATGSGICVFLSFLLQPCTAEICLIWVTKGVEENFGKEIKEWVMSGQERGNVIVHDTAVLGRRPDVAGMSVEAARRFGAEAVIVTSNPEGSRDVVNACRAAEIAAFGPIWDS